MGTRVSRGLIKVCPKWLKRKLEGPLCLWWARKSLMAALSRQVVTVNNGASSQRCAAKFQTSATKRVSQRGGPWAAPLRAAASVALSESCMVLRAVQR
mmetsp:Transcript_97727/g.226614  ORF Transcript_97727/g.226614 Transcript_97727/m.226614 type:complete len:98 (+) Transcript_97727:101-394(+)